MFRFFGYLLAFSLLVPSFHARNINDTWHGFSKFLDADVGRHVSGISDLKRYFQRFGYLEPVPGTNLTDMFDDSLQNAIFSYQKRMGIHVSGKLDSATVSEIVSPRCGVSDRRTNLHATRHYSYFYGEPKWARKAPMMLTYAFSRDHTIDYVSQTDIKLVFRRSFTRWSKVIPVNFREAKSYKSADIKIGFYGGSHGDGEPFDGVLGVLAHAFSPENGRFHLDLSETWAVDFSKEKSRVAIDLESVVTHEIGHVLGLAHSSVKEAVMYPSLRPRTKKVDLKIDDVAGVQALYGSNPDFKLSSLLESDMSSCGDVEPSSYATWVAILVLLIGRHCV